MISLPPSAIGYVETLALDFFVVFLRVGALMSLLPAFGERSVPVRMKLAISLAFTFVVLPSFQVENHLVTVGVFGAGKLLFTETLSGLLLGFGVRMFVIALQTAGSIAAQATSLSQIFGGAATEPMPAIGHILVVSGLALTVMSGLHIRMAQLIIFSFTFLPPGTFPNADTLGVWGTAQVAQAFSLAFTLAAPFVMISVLYNLTLGVINKAMPQLMVAFVGAPLITAGGLLLLFLLSPLMLSVWLEALNSFLSNPFKVQP